jgi:mono/diheme cytochrome c family protein
MRLTAVSVVLLTGCGQRSPSSRVERPSEVSDFKPLFAQNCSGCHGEDGHFGVAPPLSDPLFLAIISDDEIKQIVTAGRPGTLMPPFARQNGGTLTDKQIGIIVSSIREQWAAPTDATKKPLDYVEAESLRNNARPGNAEAGKELFAQDCAACHGDDGRGGQDGGPLNEPAFLALVSDQFLRRIIITGRPDLRMPDYLVRHETSNLERPLSSQDISDLVAYLRSWRTTYVAMSEQP